MAEQQSQKRIDRKSGATLAMPLGTVVMVEPAGLGQRFKTEFLGMERGRYLILRIPRIPGVTEHLYPDKAVTLRYVHEGHIFGFSSEVVWVMNAPFKLLFLRYPEEVEILNLRGCQRVDCFLPTAIKFKEDWQQGVILNISCGGCQAVVEQRAGQALPTVGVDDPLMLEFRLVGSEQSIMVGALTKSVNLSERRLFLGIKFDDDMPDYTQGLIQRYVDSVADYFNE